MLVMRNVKCLVIGTSLCVLLCSAAVGAAEQPEASQSPVRIEKVSLFKNGLGFFTSEATLPEGATSVRLGQLPVPAFGTFWVGYPEDVKVRSLVTAMEEVEASEPVRSIGELLLANVGRTVTLRVGPEEKDYITGTVLPPAEEREITNAASPYVMDVRRIDDRYTNRGGYMPGNVVLVKTDDGTVALNPNSIVRADFQDSDVSNVTPLRLKQPAIRMELERPAGGEPISITYLAKGITWAPSYHIDLSDPETARVSARALIVNEVADLDDVQVELITGFPNIKFGEVLSPVAMSQSLSDFLNALASGRSEAARRDHGVMAQQAVTMSNVAFFAPFEEAPVPAYSTAAEGVTSEDLFLYPVDTLTLKRGETAWVPLFTAELPYQHIYTWTIGDFLDAEGRYRNNADQAFGSSLPRAIGDSRDAEGRYWTSAEEVWHSCRLVNTLKMPLTTAATEFVTDGAFTGQDICYYTAPGAKATIRINRAMNVLAEQSEVEIERTVNAEQFRGYSYDRVHVRGELKLRNRQAKAVTVEVTKELSGEVSETTPAAKDVQTAKGLKQVNPKHVLTWEVELSPDEEKLLVYDYQVLVRH